MKILLNLLNLGTFVLFCIAIDTGMGDRSLTGLRGHLGWILGTMLLWMFTQILALMYMYRMEKFCVEIVEKFEGKEAPKP
ncbi:MAG TPA: hypothetical protein VJR29_10665 [bacterium]|nr:hypothetical protein [bacterium]HKY63872.1 hypothetical protein [bacterium]